MTQTGLEASISQDGQEESGNILLPRFEGILLCKSQIFKIVISSPATWAYTVIYYSQNWMFLTIFIDIKDYVTGIGN